MSEFQISLICYCWILCLVLHWRGKTKKQELIPALFIAVSLSIVFYLPLIAIWALRTFFMVT